MNKNSITKKISELFDLYKAGAISIEEYDKLKKQLLLNDSDEPEEEIREDKNIMIEESSKPNLKGLFHNPIITGIVAILVVIVFLIFWLSKSNNTVKDIDGNIYNTITIRDQVWMKENLKTTRYNDGTPIPLVKVDTQWEALNTPAYCWYNNDEKAFKDTYGALYNWYAIDTKKLCPKGWHVPSTEEWERLIYTSFDSESLAGGGLKETGTLHWASPNILATNSTGFTALPGGYRFGGFYLLGKTGFWWTSEEFNDITSWFGILEYDQQIFRGQFDNKEFGGSVRCIKN